MKSLILMCCIFASTDATPWYVAKARSQGDYFVDSEGYYHKAVEKENKLQSSSMASAMVTQKTAKSLCQSAFQGEAYVHICQNGKKSYMHVKTMYVCLCRQLHGI